MTDDLLNRATRALREETEEADAGARFTRARVMAGLQQTAARRRLRLAFALPLAACFVAATAFGTMKGRSTELWHDVVQALGFAHTDEAPAAKPMKRLSAKPAQVAPAPTAPEPVPVDAVPVQPPFNAVPGEPPVEAAAAAVPSKPSAPKTFALRPPSDVTSAQPSENVQAAPPPAAAPEAPDPAHELYRVAHRSHFVDHDFASALRAWDAYLAAAPSGRFAPEARYNRALCLVRLGRKDDAERALRPFADGTYGAYRRDEAKALIEALQH